jgi:hypothetical protein
MKPGLPRFAKTRPNRICRAGWIDSTRHAIVSEYPKEPRESNNRNQCVFFLAGGAVSCIYILQYNLEGTEVMSSNTRPRRPKGGVDDRASLTRASGNNLPGLFPTKPSRNQLFNIYHLFLGAPCCPANIPSQSTHDANQGLCW